MSVYKRKTATYYSYDFWLDNNRFCGETDCTSKREAEKVEDRAKEAARERLKKIAQAADDVPHTLDLATDRYWTEVGQHWKNSKDLFRDLCRLCDHFGKDKLLVDISDPDVAKMVAWRRGHHKRNNPKLPLISASTVNRSATEVLRRIFTRARNVWKMQLPKAPDWGEHLLEEPVERVRELRDHEDEALAEVVDPDYEAVRQFSLASGLRMREGLLQWSQVDFKNRVVIRHGKGGKLIYQPMTSRMIEILRSRVGHHDEAVFTFPAQSTHKKRIRGERYPITYSGLKTHWRRRRKVAKVKDFRWHDNRHTFASNLLRETKNLKLVQRGLNHSKIETTVKYTHVLDDELRAGMEMAERARTEKSRGKSRTTKRKAI